MKKLLITGCLALLVMLSGCGVNKDYVSEQISASEARTGAQLANVKSQADANATEVAKLQALSKQLGEKADLAINKAKGFENYQVIWSGEINFGYDAASIDDVAASILNEAGEKLEQHPGALLEVVGHTDASGTAKYNLLLGEKRANAAKRYLADRFGISLYRMFTLSYGEEKPVSLPDERQAASKNRRVVLNVWGSL
ncbi:MAG: OmpA family protein [candidate division Zixibacteria bacterium]|nr:OmpA family protein [candidate division Zixibacteria bacterium]